MPERVCGGLIYLPDNNFIPTHFRHILSIPQNFSFSGITARISVESWENEQKILYFSGQKLWENLFYLRSEYLKLVLLL